jgi:hypothetical protein
MPARFLTGEILVDSNSSRKGIGVVGGSLRLDDDLILERHYISRPGRISPDLKSLRFFIRTSIFSIAVDGYTKMIRQA